MNHRSVTAAAFAAAVVFSGTGCGADAAATNVGTESAQAVHTRFVAHLDSLVAGTDQLLTSVTATPPHSTTHSAARSQLADARVHYKRVEYLLEYYDAESAGELNGPPLDEVDVADGPTVIEPAQGFQVLEGMLFPAVDT